VIYTEPKRKGLYSMKGKYFGVYDLKHDETCVGVFESIAEICKFFGGITESRVWCGMSRNNALTFKTERYRVESFKEPTEHGVRKMLRQRFGAYMYKIRDDGIFCRQNNTQEWQFFAADYDEAVTTFS
jgi:hypothetical protein